MTTNPLHNSRRFDPYRSSDAAQVKEACKELQTELGLKDKRYDLYVMMVLLDLYCSWRSDPAQYIGYSRDNNRYGKNSRYTRIKLGFKGFVNLVKKLLKHGYIENVLGVCYRDPITKVIYASYTSKMRATRKLIRLVVKHKIKLSMISRHANEEVIVQRTVKVNRVSENVKFTSMPRDVERSEQVLRKYNHLLQNTYIDVDDELATIAELKAADVKEYTIDLSQKSVHRVFNDSRWDHGGRIYGAWWQGCSKELRKYITINGQPTVELDYSSIHVLLLYAHLGANFLDEGADAYTIEGFDCRSAMKIVMMCAINAKETDKADGDTNAIRATWDTLIKKLNKKRKEYGIDNHAGLYEMLGAIKERHTPIAQFLASGHGIKLQKQDSDIAIDIINQHLKKNVAVLTIHDSFIVPAWHINFTLDIMYQAYGKLVSDYLGQTYNTTVDTIHYAKGLLDSKDTTDNINVSGLVKMACDINELNEAHARLDNRQTSKQIRRQHKWNKNNHYQYTKLHRTII